MNQRYRDYFDRQVERVLLRLPLLIRRLIKDVPLHIDDRPSKKLMKELNLELSEDLCGYFCGVPLNERHCTDCAVPMPSYVILFREGITDLAKEESGTASGMASGMALRRQIRITILHEYAHLCGIDEDELEELGYG